MNTVLVVILILVTGLLLLQLVRIGFVLERAIKQSEWDLKQLRRSIKSVARSLPEPHCHQCELEERDRAAAEQERERRRKGIVVVSVACPVCQAQWDAEVDSAGEIGRMTLKTPGGICLEDNYETHQQPLLTAVQAKRAFENTRK